MSNGPTIMRRWFEEVWNNGKSAAIDQMLAPGCVIHGLNHDPVGKVTDIEAFKAFYNHLKPQFWDLTISVQNITVSGDRTIADCVVQGVHKESGNPVNFAGKAEIIVKDSQIAEAWNAFELDVMERQIKGLK